jgi:hypothetical protein
MTSHDMHATSGVVVCFCEFFVLTRVAHCKSQALFDMGSCCCAYCCLAGLLDTACSVTDL